MTDTAYAARGASKRKPHSDDAGYRCELRNTVEGVGGHVTIYEAALAGIDTGENGDRYAVVCQAHSTIGGATSMPKARVPMKDPTEFCGACRTAAGLCGD